ncbi:MULTISPECIES: shikimate kinase [unclassified Microbacterium]|uniref:shikimate kinase n=1 Tax=unclassified Microbacterium TaxID=2609290 RepID=UPI0038705E20
MTSPEPRAVVLVGPMGAGKSSIGKRLAKQLGMPFADTDSIVARAHGSIAELFVTRGEEHFRALEREAVAGALAAGGVVSLGGGAVLDPLTRDDLSRHLVISLTVAPKVVAGRLGAGAGRPLLGGDDETPLERWQRIYERRRPLYDQVADATFDTSSGPLDRIASSIAEWVITTGGHPS